MTALNAYYARLDHYTIHELVRHDPGVLSVLHDYYNNGELCSIDSINIWYKRFSGRASNFKGMLKSLYTDPEETIVAGIAGADLFEAAPYANIVNMKIHGIYSANAGGVVRVYSIKKAQFYSCYCLCWECALKLYWSIVLISCYGYGPSVKI
ncbi:hypothetical protein OIDMADRAFT_36089 [Oidiodendron maius Zn]|uniref:Uncharacterized protein n=1 Tax=Oidiodendron maius (strain Zn) TaxID=913774 RepID=A0A0C3GND3_OIDMZ|nr:hypothetical protein OIDMADRAFT_36089 [Oidiodendron maius Zn]